jgi:transcriptional regulator with XRE-family HTH domain
MVHGENPKTAAELSPAQALLKRLRTQHRLTQTEISRRTGIPQPTLSRWENDGVAEAADDALKLQELERQLTAPAAAYAGPERRKSAWKASA